jgi:hypothetical protein
MELENHRLPMLFGYAQKAPGVNSRMGTCGERKAPMGRELERYLLVGGFGIGKSAKTLGLTLHALERAA